MKTIQIISHGNDAVILFDENILQTLANPRVGDELELSFITNNQGVSLLIRNPKIA